MFWHNFTYTLKTLFRNKSLIFWTFAYPLIMASLFFMAFANIIKDENLKVIDLAIVNNQEYNDNILYKQTFDTLSDKENEDRLFNIKYVTEEKAKELLNEEKVEGYLLLENNTPKLTFVSNGINQTIIKYVVDEIHDTEKLVYTMTMDMNMGMDTISQEIEKYLTENDIKINNKASDNLDYMKIEYYTLIAMVCLYAGNVAMITIGRTLPYIKGNGKRTTISPAKKASIILSSLLASYVVQLMTIGLLFVYLLGILGVDLGAPIPYVVLLTIIGSLAGVGLGILIGTYVNSSENSKTGIMISVVMAGCFFAGMMGVGMKYLIDKNLPLINIVNPTNMVTDGFYSLYYYTDMSRYWFNVTSLLIFTGVCIALSLFKMGRAKYDSI